MPKQKRYDFKRLQGSSSIKTEPGSKDGNKISVNDRLNELRLADPAAATLKKREIAATVNLPSVPPALRNILGVPESAPPRARPGFRVRDRRTPGPAPPRSWLEGDRSGSTEDVQIKRKQVDIVRRRPEELYRFAKLCNVETISTTSLSHYCLKQLAMHWDLLEEEDYQSLAALPSSIRTKLLSYLSYYGPAISMAAFDALYRSDTTSLDLAGLIGYDTLTLSKLVKRFKTASMTSITAVPDVGSWDEDEDTAIPVSMPSFNPAMITHICLSHPPPTIRWHDLLNLTKQTPALTHLSLAYWPRPTLTPNLVTTTVSNQHGPDVVAGGSHFYSAFDQDLDEPRALLRQLSHNLLRLQWLDIDGNSSWLEALSGSRHQHSSELGVAAELTTSWRNLTYVRCARSYRPDAPWRKQKLEQKTLTSTVLQPPSLKALSDHLDVLTLADQIREQHLQWMRAEQMTLGAATSINEYRKSHGCSIVAFDLGWNYV